jgi:hypothetical protein
MEFLLTARATGLPAAFRHNNRTIVAADRFCTDADTDSFPDFIMTVARASKSVGNFVQYCISNFLFGVIRDIITAESDSLAAIFATTSAAFGAVKLKDPMA